MTNSKMEVEALLAETQWVQRLARRLLGDEQRAEDVAQDVMVAALERQERTDALIRRPRAWLGQVTRNLALRKVERRARRDHHEARAGASEKFQDPGAASLERMQMHQRVVMAVNELEEPYRTAIAMRFFEDLTSREIADRLGVEPATVRKRVSRGIEQLRARLDRDFGGDRAAWSTGVALLVERAGVLGTKSLIGAGVTAMMIVKWSAAGVVVLGLTVFMGLRAVEDEELTRPETAAAGVGRELADLAPTETRLEGAGGAAQTPSRAAVVSRVSRELPVAVSHHSGAPAAGARLVWVDGEGELRFAERLDERGRAATAVDLGEGGELGVLGATPWPHWVPVAAGPDDAAVDVVLPEGDEVVGRVWVDGRPPSEPLELGLRLGADGERGWALDASIQSFVAPLGGDFPNGQLCRGDGGFHFSLPAGERARLLVPSRYGLERGQSLVLDGPEDGRDVRLSREVVIRGRALRADGSAAPWVSFDYEQHRRRRDGSFDESTTSVGRGGGDGSFEIPALREVSEARITLRAGAQAVRRLELGPAELQPASERRDVELGDLFLTDIDVPYLRVVDVEGEPVAGARVMSPQEPERISFPASSRGELELGGLTAASTELEVQAFGFREQRIARPFGTSEEAPLRVVLERAPVLTVRVSIADEITAEELGECDLRVRVQAEEPLFEGGWSVPDWRGRWGCSSRTVRAPEGWGWMLLGLEEGELRLSGLVPGVPFALELRDESGFLLEERRSVGHRTTGATVDFEVDRLPRRFRGRVVDSQGRALEEVRVRAAAAAGGGEAGGQAEGRTDSGGAFELRGLFGDLLDLEFHRRGYVKRVEADWPTSGPEHTWVLEEGVELSVGAEDEDGRPLEIDRVEVFEIGAPVEGPPVASRSPGGENGIGGEDERTQPLKVEGVPRRPVKLRVWIDGRPIERIHDADQPSVRLSVAGSDS